MIFLAPATVLESLVSRTAGQTEAVIRVAEVRNIVVVVAVGNSGVVSFPHCGPDGSQSHLNYPRNCQLKEAKHPIGY